MTGEPGGMTTHGDSRERGRIPVSVSPGLAVAVVLVTALLSALTLPAAVPDRPGLAYVSGGLIGAVLLVGVLLAADLLGAHVARRHGVPVKAITLNAFGSRLLLARRSSTGPRGTAPAGAPPGAAAAAGTEGGRDREIGPMAIVAPLAADLDNPGAAGLAVDAKIGRVRLAVIAGVGAALTAFGVLAPAGTLALIGAVSLWVGTFALLIAAVEALPAPRSSGGLMLAAAVARRTGSAERGRAAAANVGVVTGWVLVGLGVAAAFVVGFIGLWAVLLGWLTVGSSRLAQAQQRASAALAGLTVREVMGAPPPTLSAWQTVADALAEVALPSRAMTFVVEDFDGAVGGVARLRDLAEVPLDDRGIMRVQRLVVPMGQVATARPAEALTEAVARLALRPAAGLVLVFDDTEEGGRRVVGVVGPDEVSHAIQTAPLRGVRFGGTSSWSSLPAR